MSIDRMPFRIFSSDQHSLLLAILTCIFTALFLASCASEFVPLPEHPIERRVEADPTGVILEEIPASGNRGDDRSIIASNYELLQDNEARGYGLYSYVLFARPSETRNIRFLDTLMSFIGREMSSTIRRGQLNIFYIPVIGSPSDIRNEHEVIDNYDFDYTNLVLAEVCEVSVDFPIDVCTGSFSSGGPYLVTTAEPMGREPRVPAVVIFLDFTWVDERAFRLFIDEYLAVARSRGNDRARLHSFRLRLGNLALRADSFIDSSVRELREYFHLVE